MRDGTKTKDKELLKDDKRIKSLWVEKPESTNCVVERELNPWWRELQINYLIVLIIIRYFD